MSQVGYLDGVFSTALLSNSMKGAGQEPSIAVPYQGPNPEGPYTLTMELGPKKTIPVLVLGT